MAASVTHDEAIARGRKDLGRGNPRPRIGGDKVPNVSVGPSCCILRPRWYGGQDWSSDGLRCLHWNRCWFRSENLVCGFGQQRCGETKRFYLALYAVQGGFFLGQ